MGTDWYAELGLSPDASREDITAAIERRSRQAAALANTAPERSQQLREQVRALKRELLPGGEGAGPSGLSPDDDHDDETAPEQVRSTQSDTAGDATSTSLSAVDTTDQPSLQAAGIHSTASPAGPDPERSVTRSRATSATVIAHTPMGGSRPVA